MQISRRISDRVILQFGNGLSDLEGSEILELDKNQEIEFQQAISQPNGGVILSNGRFSVIAEPPTPAVPPAPDIAGLINALTTSPSIDDTTKNKLIAALKGN